MTIISKLLRANRSIDLIPVSVGINKLRSGRCYATAKEKGLTQSQERVEISRDVRPLGEKIKETSKTVSYTGIILVGLGVTGIIFYYVFRELFSSNSPNSIYSVALEKCKNDPRIEEALGSPIKGYGEETTRRRRTRVSHAVYEKDGVKHMRMRFYIKGIRNKGVAELDMKQNEYGNYECRYLLVQLDDYSGKTFIIEDNRAFLDHAKSEVGSQQLPTLTLTQ
ncbi:mitochondrial import inner membrane translocase subunit Tim21 [Maniola hyperantus]|uniref:mitochondrial import inner membrane translocase subunit Tim21 n=1 Tax=Aphantopus hyperantus TaxID=2795564 RepID=UPI00156A54CF|nr:mitochondrial import inner membrane translocase subunit Tim21 [Maniola hyperantus]XP_034826902.1 mitochondrial import inner membrane translocase subunit Tim21 [Maniola hyperantus]